MIQTTNIRRIIDRIKRHPMLQDIPFETAVEYAVDFISIIGTPALFEEKTAIVPIHEWKGELPCDFDSMIQVRVAPRTDVKGPHPILPTYRYSEHSFHMSPYKPGAEFLGNLTYKVQGMCIFTSTKEVPVEIAYKAFAVDSEGYPLLPDNAAFLLALERYIKVEWFNVLFDQNKINIRVLQNAQQEYAWAAGRAQEEFSKIDLDKAETLFNSFKMLLPRNSSHWRGFFDLGAKENWHTH